MHLPLYDLDSGISSNITKFADDTQIGRQIGSEREAMVLQGEQNIMHEWVVKWQMDFNINKWSTLHVGRYNTGNRYTLDGVDRKIEFKGRLRSAVKSGPET